MTHDYTSLPESFLSSSTRIPSLAPEDGLVSPPLRATVPPLPPVLPLVPPAPAEVEPPVGVKVAACHTDGGNWEMAFMGDGYLGRVVWVTYPPPPFYPLNVIFIDHFGSNVSLFLKERSLFQKTHLPKSPLTKDVPRFNSRISPSKYHIKNTIQMHQLYPSHDTSRLYRCTKASSGPCLWIEGKLLGRKTKKKFRSQCPMLPSLHLVGGSACTIDTPHPSNCLGWWIERKFGASITLGPRVKKNMLQPLSHHLQNAISIEKKETAKHQGIPNSSGATSLWFPGAVKRWCY